MKNIEIQNLKILKFYHFTHKDFIKTGLLGKKFQKNVCFYLFAKS